MSQVISQRGEVTYYVHDRGAMMPKTTIKREGDQTEPRYYLDTDSDDEVATPVDYIAVQNAILDIPGLVPGTYIL